MKSSTGISRAARMSDVAAVRRMCVMGLHRQDEIARIAYELYVKGGSVPGRDLDYWLEAERMAAEAEAIQPPAAEPHGKTAGRRASKGSGKAGKAGRD